MAIQIDTGEREAVLVEDAHVRPVMGLPRGGRFSSPIPSDFNAFVYLLEGEASFGAKRRRAGRRQIAVLGTGAALTVEEATPGTRFVLMAGKPYGETPVFNGPFVD